MNVGENIKKIRENKKISQEQLSKISGVPRTSLGRYERGERTPNIDALKKIAEALEVRMFMLTGESKSLNTLMGESVKLDPINILKVIDKEATVEEERQDKIEMLEALITGFKELESSFNKFKQDYIVGIEDILKLYKEGEGNGK